MNSPGRVAVIAIVEEGATGAAKGEDRAREAADAAGLPIMVHPQNAWCSSLDEVLAVMGKRDILTHSYHGLSHGILDEAGAECVAEES